jgi:hypothetical protein
VKKIFFLHSPSGTGKNYLDDLNALKLAIPGFFPYNLPFCILWWHWLQRKKNKDQVLA